MCTQELLSNAAPLSAKAFALSPGAQVQTHGFVGSAGSVCRCVTQVCWVWDPWGRQAGDLCLLVVVYSMHTLRDSTPSMELTSGDRIRPSSRNTHTLEREKQWEGTVVFLSSC